jgi:hypothetical protein
MTVKQILDIVEGYVAEASSPLDIDPKGITIVSIPHSSAGSLPPIPWKYDPETEGLYFYSDFLSFIEQNKKPTVLRLIVYRAVYEHYLKIMAIKDSEHLLNSWAFAYAICCIKGLPIVLNEDIPLLDVKDFKNRILKIVKDLFHIECHFIDDLQNKKTKAGYPILLTMDKSSTEIYFKSRQRISPMPKVVEPSEGNLGSLSNPFNNIDDACEYIKKEEEKAYLSDVYLRDVIEKEYYYYDGIRFRVEWAMPHVAHTKNNFPEDAFIVNQVRRPDNSLWFSLKPNLYKRKFLFRGQSKYYSPCKPNIFREDKNNYLPDLIWGNEMTALVHSHPLVKLFERGIELLHDTYRFSVSYWGLQQHYYNRTSLLDLSSDINAAKFFAITDYDSSTDKYTVHQDDGKPGVLYYYDIQMPLAFQPHPDGTHLSTIGKQVFMRSGQQHGFLLEVGKEIDFNILPQVHKVFFRHDNELNKKIFYESNDGRLYFPEDMLEHHWNKYNVLFKEKKVVSLAAVKENLKLNPGETLDSIIMQLHNNGITVDNGITPSFDGEELDTYFNNIRNGAWEEFCKDIYFAGPENDMYRELLLRVPELDENKKYFRKM